MMRVLQTGLETHEALFAATRRQAERALEFHSRHSRFLRFVDTHQKWLLLHLIADTSAGNSGGIAVNWIAQRAHELGIASRNTTLAFFAQLSAYGYLVRRDNRSDRRMRLVSLSSETQDVLIEWSTLLVASLTSEECLDADREDFYAIYLSTAKAILDMPQYIRPPVDVSLMQDIRGGWLAMNHLLSGVEHVDCGKDAVLIPDFTLADHARQFAMSRSTIYRLFRLAEDAALLGWQSEKGVPMLWMSGYHLRQYCRWNARLLAAARSAIDEATLNSHARSEEKTRFYVPAAAEIRAPATRLA
jgi:AraC-like DNA-binding protein